MSKHTISILVENHSGALSQIAGLFSARGFNISSLSVAETDDPTLSRMTIVAIGDNKVINQINKQLNKLIDVVKVLDFMENDRVERELMLLTLNATAAKRHEIIGIVQIFKGIVLAVSSNEMTIELSDTADNLQNFIDLLKPYGIKEMARSGPIALAKARI